jgi:hypothetical protein
MPANDSFLLPTRRHFFKQSASSIGAVALSQLLGDHKLQAEDAPKPRAKRVIYMFQSGAPSQVDLFDYKSELAKLHGTELPASVRMGQRLTGMTAGQASLPIAKSTWEFKQYGESGLWLSEQLPHIGGIADDICVVKTVHTEAINHDPAITFFMTGNQQPGRPSIGSWVSYGIGSANENLPAFVVLLSKNTYSSAQPLYARLWGSGFLPASHQGVKFRSTGDPVLYLNDPAGSSPQARRRLLDSLSRLNRLQFDQVGDPEIEARVASSEMSYRMQMSVPELTDFSDEPEATFRLYGEDARTPGTHAANCLLARRLAERDVRFIQLFHRGWDNHSRLPIEHPKVCKEVDQGSAALVTDLKQRGLLDDTLIVWGGEFGRTVYSQGALNGMGYGRDHHPRCFSMWLAGGGVKGGMTWGETDDFCYNIARDGVHVHELNATILHCLGIDHRRLSYRFQGLDQRLTGVEEVAPVHGILS